MSIQSYAIKGIPLPAKPDPHHPIPLRKEVTTWASDPENAVQLSLFIQALIKFQQVPHTDQLSYYQIAGIHGQPSTTWDSENTDTGTWYCNHQLTTFPTWHRPYLLLFEQRLYEIMKSEVIPKIEPESEREIWEIEASHWRLPYWDWAAEQPYLHNVGLPLLFTQKQINVIMPNKGSHTFDNPLWTFKNPSGTPMGDRSMSPWNITERPFTQAVATSRHGSLSRDWINGINNFDVANKSIQAHRWGQIGPSYAISDLVSRLLTDNYLKTWRYFSSTAHGPDGVKPAGVSPTQWLSLEQIHNNIHGFTGGSSGNDGVGQMQTPAVAAFDPIFWLHHCNVDRQLAMWQTLNPDKWFDNLDQGDSTHPPDNGADVGLVPFHKDQDFNLYTSDDIRDWTQLNYQYDVLENTPRWIRAQTQGQVTDDHIAGHVRRSVNMHLNKSRHAVLAAPQLPGVGNDYIVNVLYDRYGLSGNPYSIHFFVGSAAPEQLPEGTIYQDLPGYVATVYTFSSTLEVEGRGGCRNCVNQRKAGILSKAQVVLTLKLIDHAKNPSIEEINSLHPEEVEAYLAKHLTWTAVEAVTGRVVPLQELPQTKVYVLAGKAEHFDDPHRMSQYGDYGHMWGPTEGKDGGAAPTDQGRHVDL